MFMCGLHESVFICCLHESVFMFLHESVYVRCLHESVLCVYMNLCVWFADLNLFVCC